MPVSSSTPRTRSRSPHRALTTAKDAPKVTSFDFEVTDMSGMPITLTIDEGDLIFPKLGESGSDTEESESNILEESKSAMGQEASDISSGVVTIDTLIRKLSEALHGTGREIPVLLLSLHGTWTVADEDMRTDDLNLQICNSKKEPILLQYGSRKEVETHYLMSGRLLFQYCVGNEKFPSGYDFNAEEDFCDRWFALSVEERKTFVYYRELDLQERLEALTDPDAQQPSSAMVGDDADAPAKQVQDDGARVVAGADGDQHETSEDREKRHLMEDRAKLDAVNRIYLWPIKVLLYQRDERNALALRVDSAAQSTRNFNDEIEYCIPTPGGFKRTFLFEDLTCEKAAVYAYISELSVEEMFGKRPGSPKGCEVLRSYIDRIFCNGLLTEDFMKYLFSGKLDESFFDVMESWPELIPWSKRAIDNWIDVDLASEDDTEHVVDRPQLTNGSEVVVCEKLLFNRLCVDLIELFFANYITRFVILKLALHARPRPGPGGKDFGLFQLPSSSSPVHVTKRSQPPFDSIGVYRALRKQSSNKPVSASYAKTVIRKRLVDLQPLLSHLRE